MAKNKQKNQVKKSNPAGQKKKTAGQKKKAPPVKTPGKKKAKAPGKKKPAVHKAFDVSKGKTAKPPGQKIQNVKPSVVTKSCVRPNPKPIKTNMFNIQARNAIPGTSKITEQAKKIAPKRKLDQPKQEMRNDNNRHIYINMVNPVQANPVPIYNIIPAAPYNHQQITSPASSRGFQTPNTRPLAGEVEPSYNREETRHEGQLASVQKSLIERCNMGLLNNLLDDLRHEKILSDAEVEFITEGKSTTSDKMRELCNMVRKKGDRASNILLQKLCKRDETLCSSLGIKDQMNSLEQEEIPPKKPYIGESSD